MKKNTYTLICIAIASAISVIAMFIEFPILPAAPYLKIDPSDIPAVIIGCVFSPLAGVLVELIKAALAFLIKGTTTGGIGELANFLIGGSFVLVSTLIYKFKKTKLWAILSLILATLTMTLVGALANYYLLLPLYGMKDFGTAYIMSITVPFNLIKGTLISILLILIYKPLSKVIKNVKLDK